MNDEFFTETEFSLGGKEWQIVPLDAITGKYVFYKHVRPCLGVLGDLQISKEDENGNEVALNHAETLQAIASWMGLVPQEHLIKLTDELVKRCLWLKSSESGGKYYPVMSNAADDRAEAFSGLKVSDLTILDVRLFCVNFGESVSDLMRNFLGQPEADMAVESQKSKRSRRTRSS